jgi:hypothetical protein
MYKCRNHDDNSKSVRHQAWVTNSNLVKSSVEEYYYYLHNYGSILTFNRDGEIECDFDSGISTNPALKILLCVPTQEDEEKEEEKEEDEDEEEEEEEDDEEEEEDIPLQNMNDLQIEKYVERIGLCPRDECDKWTMVYAGGAILRYSYCNFSQWHIEDQTVSNVTITRAIFNETTFTNYVFDNVTFDECVFMDVILNNTTFKNSKFIECELDSRVPDKSCEVVKYKYNDDDDYDHVHFTYYYHKLF